MSILLGLTRHVIYTCVIKCRSTLGVPDWKVAHKEKLTVLHASFIDYLKDPSRSGEFYVGSDEDFDIDFASRLFTIWHECNVGGIGTGMHGVLVFIPDINVVSTSASVKSAWHRYCLKWDDKPSKTITKFHGNLFGDFVTYLAWIIGFQLRQPAESPIYAQLCKVHMIQLFYHVNHANGTVICYVVDALLVKYSQLHPRI
jgi:hypothetical protein